jgi:hypothetical protein
MSDGQILYEALVFDALRGVVRAVLTNVQKRGVPGDHHFYITFDTQAPGVGISKRLREQYPQDMTIVLQHQFWDLNVTEDRFEVRLSFNTIPERLVIPFGAIRMFSDPSVQFALALRAPGIDQPPVMAEVQPQAGPKQLPPPPPPPPPSEPARMPALPKPLETVAAAEPKAAHTHPRPSSPAKEPERKSAEVVSLDKFRKK